MREKATDESMLRATIKRMAVCLAEVFEKKLSRILFLLSFGLGNLKLRVFNGYVGVLG